VFTANLSDKKIRMYIDSDQKCWNLQESWGANFLEIPN